MVHADEPPASLSVAELSVLADGATKTRSLNFQMGDAIHVKLAPGNLTRLQAAAAEKRKKLGLSLNGHFLSDVPALVMGSEELVFVPSRNDASKAFWDELWGGRLLTPQTLSVAVRLEDGSLVVTSSVLGLMGIGAGTALGAVLLDQNANDAPPKESASFFKDVLTDGATIGLHRFQMTVWTVVLFFIFSGAVWNKLALPEFDNTLLALMGVSAGAYLGFKFPENRGAAA